jgi:hypothetical protein
MNKVELLHALRDFTQKATKDMILPVKVQKVGEWAETRPADIYLMRLPDSKAATKKAPYILHQVITGKDAQKPGDKVPEATAVVRSVFCVYSANEEVGGLHLLGLMERLRLALLKQVVLVKQFELDLEDGVESLIYPEDTAPYFAGEMVTTWKLPAVKREVIYGNQEGYTGLR